MCHVAHRPRKEPGVTYYCILPPGHEGQHRCLWGVVWGKKPQTETHKGWGSV